ncbi:NAD(P)/FAD-dependent oxidoreductase [Dactylosporangium sp. CS-047395]|uniref:NAD(P)/FAD-dependent oxidoreductase n=1 Tax=Dactylosporangium sp. CS-047395 TaxID=3239936 RepID=UPI003D8E1011
MLRYDVIVVGARPAGAAVALLLARAGLRVLAVDRARFPSDTLSTHQVQPPGVALLRRWGLLEGLLAAGAPMVRTAKFAHPAAVLEGAYPGADGVLSPRRTVLDALLVGAARDAGAEVWEGFGVSGLRWDGGRVAGIDGAFKRGGPRSVAASLVVGADGKHSTVARLAGARDYRVRPAMTAAFYGYVEGLGLTGGEVYPGRGGLRSMWPTNDGLAVAFLSVPRERFAEVRELGFLASFGDRLAGARLAAGEPVRATVDLPNTFRVPYGPGWALAGDAGLVMDPITGQGIGNALRDADALAAALVAGLGGGAPLDRALAGYQRSRDRQRRAMYRLTTGAAGFGPERFGSWLYPAIARDPADVSRFLGVLAGLTPPLSALWGFAKSRALRIPTFRKYHPSGEKSEMSG